jgi:hypothetical protein
MSRPLYHKPERKSLVRAHIKDAPTFRQSQNTPPWESGSWSIILLRHGALRFCQRSSIIFELQSFLLFSSDRLHKERLNIASERYTHLDVVVEVIEVGVEVE